MRFKEHLAEQKSIGTLYHFTRPRNIKKIISVFNWTVPWEVISTPRNEFMSEEIWRDDFNIRDGYIVRISFDGNKLSNKYKIKPVVGYSNNDPDIFNQTNNSKRVKGSTGESEEVILNKEINILPYIKQIDIYNHLSDESNELYNWNKQNTKIRFPLNIVRKFKIVEGKYYYDDDTYYQIILNRNVSK